MSIYNPKKSCALHPKWAIRRRFERRFGAAGQRQPGQMGAARAENPVDCERAHAGAVSPPDLSSGLIVGRGFRYAALNTFCVRCWRRLFWPAQFAQGKQCEAMATARSAKLIEEIAAKIRAKIVSGEYAPGIRLKQETLAEEFAVSRTPIREALSRLEAQGIVVQEQRRSAIVSTPSSRDIAEMYQIRAELEGLAAQLAARWITDDQLASLRASHDRFVRAVKALRKRNSAPAKAKSADKAMRSRASADWITTNAEFHSTIAAASNNRNLQRMLGEIRSGYTEVMSTSSVGMDTFRMDANIRHHEMILSALERRDPARSRTAMNEHILEAGEIVVAWFQNQRDK
jgi:DNA-binding GntR family transcriptional regulator